VPQERTRRNNDRDANPSTVDDILHIGGEDSWYRAVRLNRSYDADRRVQVDPDILVEVPAWTDELLERIGDGNVSIESSPALTEDRGYWVDSGGRLVGLELAAVERGEVDTVLDHWVGDDADASIELARDGDPRGLARTRRQAQSVACDGERLGEGDEPVALRSELFDDLRQRIGVQRRAVGGV
jgi:hypothetical protein